MLAVIVSVIALLCAGLLASEHWRWRSFTERRRIRRRARARRGLIPLPYGSTGHLLPASDLESQATAVRQAISTGSFPRRGPQSEAEIPSTPPQGPSRTTAPGSSGSVTGRGPGDPTTDADELWRGYLYNGTAHRRKMTPDAD